MPTQKNKSLLSFINKTYCTTYKINPTKWKKKFGQEIKNNEMGHIWKKGKMHFGALWLGPNPLSYPERKNLTLWYPEVCAVSTLVPCGYFPLRFNGKSLALSQKLQNAPK